MKKTKVTIQAAIDTTSADGILQQEWVNCRTVSGLLIHEDTGGIAQKEAGIDIQLKYQFIHKGRLIPELNDNNRIIILGQVPLYIIRVSDYGRVQVVSLNDSRER